MKAVFILIAVSTFAACSSDGDSNNGNNNGSNNGSNGSNNGSNTGSNNGDNNVVIEVPDTYTFESRFNTGESSTSYSGQTFRHLLISDLATYIGGLSDDIDTGKFAPSEEDDVIKALDTYFRFDSAASGAEPFLFTTMLATKQITYDDVSTEKNIVGKLAGNDSVTDHKDWSTEFKGWSDQSLTANGGSTTSPEGLIVAMFETLEKQAIDRVNGIIPEGEGVPLPVHITPGGLDLKQLIEKVLLMGVTFSQGVDDYLDDDVDGKGLLSSNTQSEDKPYTNLEHAWDEGFGYFGAASNYSTYTDEQLAEKENIDTDKDGVIDIKSEHNWGASINAGKRDKGSTSGTDYTSEIFAAFLKGRTLIANAGETLTEAELTELKGYRDDAVRGWENAIAATIIHYINENIAMIETIGDADYDFITHTKVWSELKGFSLGLQFNPRSPMQSEFENLHTLVGDKITGATEDLVSARTLMQTAYGFDAQDVENW